MERTVATRERLMRLMFTEHVRGNLRGIWVRNPPGVSPYVWAANHHSWWDGFVAGAYLWARGQDAALVMDRAQLENFKFFRHVGVVGAHEPRRALAALAAGRTLVVYPEGKLLPPAGLGPLQRGAVWLAQRAGVPVVPVAVRVVMRGQQSPEAYLDFGEPLLPATQDPDSLRVALSQQLAGLDQMLADNDCEQPLPGFAQVVAGRPSTNERIASLSQRLSR